MLDLKFIRQNPEIVKKAAKDKQVKVDIDQVLKLDEEKRRTSEKIETLRHNLNLISTANKKPSTPEILKAKKIKKEVRELEDKINPINKKLEQLLFEIPNLPLDNVPIGKNEKDSVVLRKWGEKPRFNFKPRDYLDISEHLDLIDIKRAAKVSGTRFGYLKREIALLEFALVQLAFGVLTKESFVPTIPPVMIKSKMARAMGYLEQLDREEAYYFDKDNLYLVGTSEQSIGPMHAGEIFEERDLPKKYVAFSTCFRREAGAYGKDTKGILRVHQFDKVEMFSFCKPEDSVKEHEFFLSLEEGLMKLLEIPYRIIHVYSGGLSLPSASTYDLESWMPGQGTYRETHSTSNCTDFQARRLDIKYRDKKSKKLEFVHTINGTAFAIGRTIVAIVENYQKKDGSMKVPRALQKFLNFDVIK